MVDPVWAGVVGAVGGAGVGALTSLAAPLINWRVERKRTAFEWQRATIREWREGLAAAAETYTDWERTNDHQSSGPTFEGQLWYESLRPHLSDELRDGACWAVTETVRELADEIARIEREWKLSPSPGLSRRQLSRSTSNE